MKRLGVKCLGPIVLSAIWLSGEVLAEGFASDSVTEPVVIREGSVTRAVGLTLLPSEAGVRILVDGLAFEDVSGWTWKGRDIAADIRNALADGSAVLHETGVGFEIEWRSPPSELKGNPDGRLTVEALSQGVAVTAAATAGCPAQTEFGEATRPLLSLDPRCKYGSNVCLQPGKRHTGMDFPGNGDAIAIAAGLVIRVEQMNAHDHGMGNNVSVRHVLPGPNCATIYSSYSHLQSIGSNIAVGQSVAKGQSIGTIGGSGNGNPNAFAPHLHLEVKSRAVSGNPFGVGLHFKSCSSAPLHARRNTCWRYVGNADSPRRAPDDYGYLNPAGYLNKTFEQPVYRQVSAGQSHTCALTVSNTLSCWGDNADGQAVPPSGAFKQVSAGMGSPPYRIVPVPPAPGPRPGPDSSAHTCALRADQSLACWGDNYFAQANPPRGTFKQVDSGGLHGCAIQANDTVVCWGDNREGQTDAPTGQFKQLSAGSTHNCAIKKDDTLVCWGYGQSSPPAGTFKQVSAGNDHTCAVRTDNTLTCWGSNSVGQATPPVGKFKQVAADYARTCGLRLDKSVTCWPANDAPAGRFLHLEAGGGHTCGLKEDNTVLCWGANSFGKASAPAGRFKQISAATLYYNTDFWRNQRDLNICAIRLDNSLECWGGHPSPPAGQFKQVSAGIGFACALGMDDTLSCWGAIVTPPGGLYGQVSAGQSHACAVKSDNSVVCWGYNSFAQANPPAGAFRQVSAGDSHSCAIKMDGMVACWGANQFNQASPPSGTFQQVSAGVASTCGLRTDNTLACWGKIDRPPEGQFKQVSAGGTVFYFDGLSVAARACALTLNNRAVCWGFGSSNPSGTFVQVIQGSDYACGIRTDGFVNCWGGIVR
ncbi:MAG: peptidoglycan DD-metalloendopeptidase family protein [Methylococcales bacterium]